MRALVLGGNGFIGTHLVDALKASGVGVRVYDRPGSLRYPANARVDYRYADFHDQGSLAEALADVDVVFHLISSTVPSTSNLDPIADVQDNLLGSLRLLQQMRQTGVRRIIFLSSGGTVYGNPTQLPVSEDHPLSPISSYGVVKVGIENYLTMYASLYGFQATVLRVSNPYGPRQAHIGVQGVIPTFFGKIAAAEPITIWGKGDVIRDYIYIDDVTNAVMKVVEKESTGIFNIGSGVGESLLDVVKTVSKVSGQTPQVVFKESRSFDVKAVVLDTAKARSELSWEPIIGLEAGCEKFWAWMKAQDESNDSAPESV